MILIEKDHKDRFCKHYRRNGLDHNVGEKPPHLPSDVSFVSHTNKNANSYPVFFRLISANQIHKTCNLNRKK